MAATVNDRDVMIAAGTRTQPVELPSDYTVTGDVTGTLNGVPVQDVIDAANAPGSGDVTKDILENSGTTILMSSSNLFKTTTGLGGVFIGGGGLFGKDTGGNTTFSINGTNGNATFKGTVQAGSIIAVDATIDGVNAVDVKNNASNGYTAFQDTVDFRVPGAPTNSPVISSISASSSSVGTVDVKLTWTYAQGAIKADQFILYYLEGTTNPTTSSPVLAVADGDAREVTISGVPMDKSYKVGIVAARKSAFGIQKTAIVNAWTRAAATPNIAYSVISGGPPASATTNYFTTSTSDPSGGSNGDAHWNSASSTMWFKTGGVWRVGGTVNAGQITVGTLAAARIAAGSITSDKISVTSLSAVSANLGSVTAGSITGTANIDITGQARFRGTTTYGGSNWTAVVNEGGTTTHGILGNAGTNGFGVRGTAGSGGIALSGSNSAGGVALECFGQMTINNTSLVTNLNADMVDGYNQSSFCRFINCDSGSSTVSGAGFQFNSYVAGTRTRGTGAQFMLESTSDERLKQDIAPEPLGLDFINALHPVEYRLKSRPEMKYHGFIAQDMRSLITADDDCLYQTNLDGTLGVDYVAMIAPLVNAIQELTKKIEAIEQGN